MTILMENRGVFSRRMSLKKRILFYFRLRRKLCEAFAYSLNGHADCFSMPVVFLRKSIKKKSRAPLCNGSWRRKAPEGLLFRHGCAVPPPFTSGEALFFSFNGF